VASWDAKARFSEVVRRVRSEGPQNVTVHGRDEVVVISAEESRCLKANERRRAYRRDAGLALPRHRYLTGARPDAGARRRSVTGWLLDTEPRRPKPELKVLAFIAAHPLIRGCARPLNMRAIRFCRMRCCLFFMGVRHERFSSPWWPSLP
jgi:prevent-host-death family protein